MFAWYLSVRSPSVYVFFSICTYEDLIYSNKVVISCTNRVPVNYLPVKRKRFSLRFRRTWLIEEKREILIIQSTPLVQRGVLATISSPSYKDISVFTLNLKFRVFPCTWRPVWRIIENEVDIGEQFGEQVTIAPSRNPES